MIQRVVWVKEKDIDKLMSGEPILAYSLLPKDKVGDLQWVQIVVPVTYVTYVEKDSKGRPTGLYRLEKSKRGRPSKEKTEEKQ